MKRLASAVLVVLAIASPLQAALSISGPDKVAPQETFLIEVDGATFDLTETSTIADIVNEVRKVQVQHENELLGVELRMRIVPDGFQVTIEAEVTAPAEPGVTFVFAIDRTDKARAVLPVAFHAIQVGEVPEPDPPVPPIPDKGPRYLLFLREQTPDSTADPLVAAGWATFFTRLRAEEKKGLFKEHVIKDADDDATQTAYAPYQAKRTNDDPTPTLFLIENEPPHRILWHGPSPSTIQNLKAKVAEFGG